MKQDLQKGAAICISVADINNKNNRKCDSWKKLYSNGIGKPPKQAEWIRILRVNAQAELTFMKQIDDSSSGYRNMNHNEKKL